LFAPSGWVSSHSAPRGAGGIEPKVLPPRRFIAVAMDLAMVSPAQRDLVAERPILGKTQVMGVTGPSSADQAGLL
jgi:hypothetical protein